MGQVQLHFKDFNGPGLLPRRRARGLPGSDEKIDELAERVRQRETLWRADDPQPLLA
jgi:hypothetical protein